MESYRFITRTVATDLQGHSSDLNLSARRNEQNIGQLNDQDTAYVLSLREHYYLTFS